MAQQGQAVPPLLQKVPQRNQNVRRGQRHLVHQGLEKGEVAVNITDHKNPPPRRQRGPVYNRSVHKGSLPNEDALSIPQKAGGIQVGRIQEASYRAFYCAHADWRAL